MKCIHIISIILGIAILSSCEKVEDLLDKSFLQISIPQNISDYSWAADTQRVLFFVKDHTVETETFASSESEVMLYTEKTQNIPVLACILFKTSVINLQDCNFALGGVYPFDAHDGILSLKSLHHADVAQILLTLYQQQVNIHTINIHKLYATIDKKIPESPINTDKFFEYVIKNKLSYWGIKSLDTVMVILPTISHEWISCNNWVAHILPSTNTIMTYPGKWRFVRKDSADVQAVIYIDKNQQVFLYGFD